MAPSRIFTFAFFIVMVSSVSLEGKELPTTIACTSNAKASRDYSVLEKRWEGEEGIAVLGKSQMFKFSPETIR